jgi:hypothetical protein
VVVQSDSSAETERNRAGRQTSTMRYPLDSMVTVAWNPNAPEVAAAEPGFYSEALLLPGAGLAFLFPGIMCIVLYFGMSESNTHGSALASGCSRLSSQP